MKRLSAAVLAVLAAVLGSAPLFAQRVTAGKPGNVTSPGPRSARARGGAQTMPTTQQGILGLPWLSSRLPSRLARPLSWCPCTLPDAPPN